jgi:hypothetical protein|uniref:Uncharacterized protein n=1 Tax=Sipha flava TaxID=143950 RepID=A0A2S2Q8U9_9HEMI
MSKTEDIAVVVAAIIIGTVKSQQDRCRRLRRFWVRISLVHGRQKNSTDEFVNDLLLDEVDQLNLEHRWDSGFQNFFRLNNSDFENILSMFAPKFIKKKRLYILLLFLFIII